MNRDFTINVTEERQRQILEYLNDMQEGVDKNRNNGNDEGFLSAMHYRDGFCRALMILGIDWECNDDNDKNSRDFSFIRIKKDIYKN